MIDTKLLRQKILDLAIRGKLVPQDPADEPASELLKKIKVEKEALVKAGKIKRDKHESFIFKGDDNRYYETIDGKTADITEEIPFYLPESWVWCRLANLASYKKGPFGSSITKAMFVPKGCNTYKVYEQKNAIQKNANIGDYFISKQKFNELKNFEVHPGDIIVSCAGTIGETFVLPPKIYPGIINQALMKIKLFASEIKDFYLLYFDYILKSEANEKGKGSAMKNIPPFDVLKKMLLPLPPLAEQQRIVEQIETLFGYVDIIDTDAETLDKTLTLAKQKILDLAIRGKLVPQDPADEPASELLKKIKAEKDALVKAGKLKKDKHESYIFKGDDNCYYEQLNGKTVDITDEVPFDLPESWCWCRLGNIGSWGAGATPSRNNKAYYQNGTIPWLKTGDLNDGDIYSVPEYITEKALRETSVQLNPVGSILIAMYGATIGKVGVLQIPATTNQACCACSVFNGINNRYLFLFLLSQKENFKTLGGGGAQPNISKDKIVNYLFPLPPITEQLRIVQAIAQYNSILELISK